jgi:U2-associated protein SR140
VQIVDVWERDWIIFEPGVIEDFKQRLSGTTVATESTHEDDAPLDSTSMPSTTAPTLGAESDVAAPSPRPGFKNTGFKTTFLPSALTAALPDEVVGGDEEGDLDGEDVDGAPMMIGEEEDVDGNEVDLDDVDGEEMAVVAAPTEVLVLEDDDAMDMGSDDDMF